MQELQEVQALTSADASAPYPLYLSPQVPPVFDAVYALLGDNGLDPRRRFLGLVDLLMRDAVAGGNPNFDVRGRPGWDVNIVSVFVLSFSSSPPPPLSFSSHHMHH